MCLVWVRGPERPFVVVFSTAYDEHALRAFDHHAVDYLLKPYDRARFRRALDKARAQLAANRPAADAVDARRRRATSPSARA
jgi:two-component system LytT family response regulator